MVLSISIGTILGAIIISFFIVSGLLLFNLFTSGLSKKSNEKDLDCLLNILNVDRKRSSHDEENEQ